jgi:hypothetical protein
MQPGG